MTIDRSNMPTIAVDLDGVLARYEGWQGVETIGDPIPEAREFLHNLRRRGRVVIYTVRTTNRGDTELTPDELVAIIEDWLNEHDMPYDEVWTGPGKPIAVAYVDDRAVLCDPQTATCSPLVVFYCALHAVDKLIEGPLAHSGEKEDERT